MERTTLEIIAPSVEEALARGLEQLGVSKELVDMEVLDEGTRGFLGLGSRQVRIRLSLKSADEKATPLASRGNEGGAQKSTGEERAAAPISGDALLAYAEQVTSEMLGHMKVAAKVSAHYAATPDAEGDLPMLVDIHGDDLSVLIGRRA